VSHDKEPSLADLYPLPEGVRLRSRKFGANPVTPLQPTPSRGAECASGDAVEFLLRHEDQELGLFTRVREDADSHHLIAEVFSIHSEHLNQAAVSVALVGTVEDQMIRKTIPLNTEEHSKYRCSGSADFGKLEDAIRELGAQLGLIVFLVV
jgi:hypothetical protein